MEVLENVMQMFVAGSDDEVTKIRSGIVDDERVNEGNCRWTFKDWVTIHIFSQPWPRLQKRYSLLVRWTHQELLHEPNHS